MLKQFFESFGNGIIGLVLREFIIFWLGFVSVIFAKELLELNKQILLFIALYLAYRAIIEILRRRP